MLAHGKLKEVFVKSGVASHGDCVRHLRGEKDQDNRYWVRTITKDELISHGDLLKVIHRYYHHRSVRKVALKVHKHRGHFEDKDWNHPRKLLDGKKGTHYCSKPGSPQFDWIIFKQKKQRRFLPTNIMVRNSSDTAAIRSIAILWSEDGVKYQDLIKINNIKNDRCKEKQWFELNAEQGHFMKFLKLNILGNHYDSEQNFFCEFGVFGVLE